MHPEALRISLPDARSAVLQRRMHREVKERCSLLFVLSAVRSARCPSSPPRESLFTAAHASQQREKTTKTYPNKKPVFRQVFYFFVNLSVQTRFFML